MPYKTPESLIAHVEPTSEAQSLSRRESLERTLAETEEALLMRRGSTASRRTTTTMMQERDLAVGAGTPVSPMTREAGMGMTPLVDDGKDVEGPSVPEPMGTTTTTTTTTTMASLHTCSTPASRDTSPEVFHDDPARARRIGALTRDRARDIERGRAQTTGTGSGSRCASESPTGRDRIPRPAASHIHAVDIHAAQEHQIDTAGGGMTMSSSLGRLASRSRTRTSAGRTASVSPSRLGRWRGSSLRNPSPATTRHSSIAHMPTMTSTPAGPLLDFSQISEYIIGKSALKHRLVTCTLGRHRILSFPCVIEDERYPRNQFIWNVAFVFDRASDLSAFEPVVRKCGRIFRACEVRLLALPFCLCSRRVQLDSQYLTHRSTRANIQNVIDQMFEDLNSYSETSITIDGINYLELKLFPFYRESARPRAKRARRTEADSDLQRTRPSSRTGMCPCP